MLIATVVHFGDDSTGGKDTAAGWGSGEQWSSVMPGHREGRQGDGPSPGETWQSESLCSPDEVSVCGNGAASVDRRHRPITFPATQSGPS